MSNQATDIMSENEQPIVATDDQPLKRSSSLKKATQKLAKKLSIKGIKSRLSGVDPADLELLEQIIAENEQQEKKPTKKKFVIKISTSRAGSRAGSRTASPRIGTQVEEAEAQQQTEEPVAAAVEPVAAAVEAVADTVAATPTMAPPKPSGWRWGKALFAVAVGIIASGAVMAAHHVHRAAAAPVRGKK